MAVISASEPGRVTKDRRVAWSAAEAGVSGVLSVISVLLVARIVGPASVGVGAAAVAVNVMLWVLVNAVFADAIVQAPELTPGAVRGAGLAGVALGVVAACVQIAAGPVLAALIGDSRMVVMAAVLAAPLPLVGAGGVAQGRLTRERRYRSLAARAIVGQGAGILVGIGSALSGAGAWAIVAQQATVSAVGAAVLVGQVGGTGHVGADWAATGRLLRMGGALAVGTLAQTARYRLFALVVGASAGPTNLGQVHMAFRVVDTARDLALTALWRLMLPPMSERQRDLPSLQATVDRCLRLIGLVVFPMAGMMVAVLSPLTAWLLGPAWTASGEAASVLALLLIYVFAGFPGGVATIARGRAGASLASQVFGTVMVVGVAAAWRPASPMAAVTAWLLAHGLSAPVAMAVSARAMRVGWLRPMRAGVPALLLTVVATGAALMVPTDGAPASVIALRLSVIAAVYGAGVALWFRPLLTDALGAAGLIARPAAPAA